MKHLTLLILAITLASCAVVTPNTPGVVTQSGDGQVIIVGPKEHGRLAEPTERMIAQAREVCSSATFRSARPFFGNSDEVEYIFAC